MNSNNNDIQEGGANYQNNAPNTVYNSVPQNMNQNLNLNPVAPGTTQLYNIPAGTILYHGSLNKESFNPYDIRLGDDRLVSYFSQSKRLAADYIIGCALYPTKSGFLHKFRVKKDITKILIISPHERQNHWTLKFIEDSFCSRKFRIQLDGIGFFFPKSVENIVSGSEAPPQQDTYDSEFAICNPNEFLQYVSTQRCISMRKLNPPYSFDDQNPNV
tara:strand:- start:1168 stop:1815 length:648 start_codon:yes stop_codon:yes gene_type:complete